MPESCSNSAQDMAIRHVSGPMQVLAGPGSGKTYLTIHRVRHLIRNYGIPPEHILVITFTKAAAAEMEQRFLTLTEAAYPQVHFGTFHAVYYHILRNSLNIPLYLTTFEEKLSCLKHAVKDSGMEDADTFLLSCLLKKISRVKNNTEPDELMRDASFLADLGASDDATVRLFPQIFKEYCSWMEKEHKIDFDDIILRCDRLLTSKPDILAFWQKQFSFILIDEFQDISPLQYRIIRMLASPEDNLFVVGDDDQSVYGFRGAGPDIMRQFMMDYPQAKQLTLSVNYRCAESIVHAAGTVIAANKNRYEKKIISGKSGDINGKVNILPFSSREDEHAYLTKCLKAEPTEELCKSAVIFRTNAEAAFFSRQLAACHIPFCLKEQVDNLFESPVAKDLIAYLRFADASCSRLSVNAKSDGVTAEEQGGCRADFFRIMNRPLRYICRDSAASPTVSEAVLLHYYREKPYMIKTIRQFYRELNRIAALCPYLAIDYIRRSIGYNLYLKTGCSAAEYAHNMETADSVQESAAGIQSFKEWYDGISDYTSILNHMKKQPAHMTENAPGIRLMTMHAAKGLEFEKVWLPEIREGSVPIKKASSPGQIEEERRLFYVAMTRAKTSLQILFHGTPSRFITPLFNQQVSGQMSHQSTSSSNSELSRYSSKASATSSYSASSSI